MKNNHTIQEGLCALFFLTLLSNSFGQNPILKSTTTSVPALSGVTSSLITENGNFIGIGTTTPTKRLTIKGFATYPGGLPEVTSPIIRFEYNTFSLPVTTRNWELSANLNDFNLRYDNAGIVPIRVQDNGTVHLMDKLYLNLPTGFNRLGFTISNTKRQISWGDDLTGTPLEFMYDPNGTLNDLSIMTLTPTGKVGIGTGAPSERLEISGGNVKVNNGNFTVYNGRLIIESTTGLGSGTKRIALNSDGTIRAREILVDLVTIPDYVFADKYSLMPLKDLKVYIRQNKHLPGIQSESEYEKQGHINVGELNVKLLEKVEELTLYILQLEEKMEKMNREIEAIYNSQK
jgi:hypothetical protein